MLYTIVVQLTGGAGDVSVTRQQQLTQRLAPVQRLDLVGLKKILRAAVGLNTIVKHGACFASVVNILESLVRRSGIWEHARSRWAHAPTGRGQSAVYLFIQ